MSHSPNTFFGDLAVCTEVKDTLKQNGIKANVKMQQSGRVIAHVTNLFKSEAKAALACRLLPYDVYGPVSVTAGHKIYSNG